MYDVIVIGGGPAGATAALRASELGARVALIERDRLGGTCTNDGCVPTRALAKAARLLRDAQQLSNYGIEGELPTLNFGKLGRRVQEIVEQVHEKKGLLDLLRETGVEAFTERGAAKFIDAHTLGLEDGTRLEGEKIIICAGGHARKLPFPGADLALTHSSVWEMTELPRSVAIIGAAATGCQLASVFSDFGSRVTLVDLAPRVLPGEDIAVSDAIAHGFRQRGIDVMTGIGSTDKIERSGEIYTLTYMDAEGQTQTLGIDAVIMAVGWPGNVEGLGLEAAGVDHERSYIKVDEYLCTSQPHIFAAGDINGQMMLVQSATHEARIAAENAVLDTPLRWSHGIVPLGGFTDPEYGCVGPTEEEARQEQDVAVVTIPYTDLDRALIDGRRAGFCKLIAARHDGKVLAAHVVGEQATEVAQLVAAAMVADATVDQLAGLELAYPTYTAIVGLAARQLATQMRRDRMVPQWRALARPHVAEWERSHVEGRSGGEENVERAGAIA